jgi:N-acyl-D-amino-acid deacylase
MIKRLFRISAYLTALFIFFLILKSVTPNPDFDILIQNGFILDGTGNPWFKGDIGITGNRIEKIGNLSNKRARTMIDASNLIVAPGFIDVHTHCDRKIDEVPTADNYILQGVTTVIGGNCGGHSYPIQDLFTSLKESGVSVNFGCLVGHNTIRREVMGQKMDPPTEDEMKRMKNLIRKEMELGALGFSTGLAYLPGTYSTTKELVSLVSALIPFGGIYTTHLRDQGQNITQSIKEAIEIGEKNDMPVLISHIKLADDAVWGKTEMITEPVESARDRGVEVFLDQYPYTATSSGFTSSFPSWSFEGGREEFLKRLKEEGLYQKIKAHIIERRLTSTKNIDKISTIYIASSEKNPEYVGKNLREILISQDKEPSIDKAVDLIIDIEKNGGAQGIFFQMNEEDVEYLMGLPYTMHASDGGIQVVGDGMPHPRNYGTFPRVVSHYVRDRGVIPLEEAIRKMTSLPAQAFRIQDRGMLREGMFADITIFDNDSFKDNATFSDPHRYSVGLTYVIVNGEIVVSDGRHTGRLPGMMVYGPGKKQEEENES